MPESVKPFDRLDYTYKLFVVVALVIAVIVMASDIFIPLAFAGLLSIVMLPFIKKMERRKIPTWLSISVVLCVTIVVLVVLVWIVVIQIGNLVRDLPDLEARFTALLNNISHLIHRNLKINRVEQNKMIEDGVRSVSTYLGNILLSMSGTLSTIVQIPIYIFLILIYRLKFKNFFIRMFPDNTEFVWKKEIERVIQGYILGLMLVTIIISTMLSIGLLLIGIEHAIFFGILAGMLTIIPYVGIIIGASFPVLMALLTKDSLWYPVGVVCVFVFVQFTEGNFITPRITGSRVSINALAAIIALVIGGKLLGIVGMILAVPAIGVLKVILSHSSHLKPFVTLLEDKDGYEPDLTLVDEVVNDDVIDDHSNPS